MAKYKIAIGLTTGDYKTHLALPISLIKMLSGRDWSDYEFVPLHSNGIYIEMNRNNIAAEFMKATDCDFLYFWDHDNGIYPEAFDIFMEDMQDPNIHILSGLYYRKQPEMMPVCGIQQKGMGDGYTIDTFMFLSAGLIDLTTYAGSVSGMTGAGALMIRREVFDNVEYPWFRTKFDYLNSMGKYGFTTEDTIFCELAQKAGYHIWLDTRIRSPHYYADVCWPEEWRQFGEKREPSVRNVDETDEPYEGPTRTIGVLCRCMSITGCERCRQHKQGIVEGAKQSVEGA